MRTTPARDAESERSALDIRLFGPMDVRVESRPLPPLRSRKVHYLLALLALRGGREVEREWLAATLWPESEAQQSFYNLRRALYDLRQGLGACEALIVSPSPHTLILKESDSVAIDAIRFDALIAVDGMDALREAAGLYRGPLLEGCAEDW